MIMKMMGVVVMMMVMIQRKKEGAERVQIRKNTGESAGILKRPAIT